MYKQIIFYVLFFISICCYGQKTAVYENEKQVGYMNEKTDYDCNNCYFLDTIFIFKKPIIIKEAVYVQGRVENDSVNSYFSNQYSLEISKLNNTTSIIKFNSTSNGNSYLLYVSIKNGCLFIVKHLSYANAVYNEEPSTKVCSKKLNIKIIKRIDFYDYFENKDVEQNCHFCPITTSVEQCVRKNK